MGNLIGSVIPALPEGVELSDVDHKEQSRKQKAWNAIFYAEVVDPHGDEAEFAEVDVIVVTDADNVVLAYNVVRFSVDEPEDHGILFGESNGNIHDWVRSLMQWGHDVPGMHFIYWMHVHPEGHPLPGNKDKYSAKLAAAMDLIISGHIGKPKAFQALAVSQRAGIISIDGEVNAVSPAIDAEIARVYSRTYARVLGVDHPLTIAQQEMTDALAEFAEREDHDNPLAMMVFVMTELNPIMERLEAAKVDVDDDDLRELINADYPKWLAEGKPDAEGGQRPYKELTERLDLPDGSIVLPQAILDGLAGFDFSGLDA